MEHIQTTFDSFQVGRLHNLSTQPLPVLLMCFILCPVHLVLSLGATEKIPARSSLHPPFRCLYTVMWSFSAFSSPNWTVPALSSSPNMRDALVPWSSYWPLTSSGLLWMHKILIFWFFKHGVQLSSKKEQSFILIHRLGRKNTHNLGYILPWWSLTFWETNIDF